MEGMKKLNLPGAEANLERGSYECVNYSDSIYFMYL